MTSTLTRPLQGAQRPSCGLPSVLEQTNNEKETQP